MQPRLKIDIGWRDLASILLPVRQDLDRLEAQIAAHAPADVHVVVGLSVRSLFLALLSETAASAKPVAMSAVTVADMASLAQASGCTVRPIDIDLATLLPAPEAARLACGDDAGMLVIAHIYGTRGSMEGIAAACAAPGRLIVEDCAQAFDGRLFLSPGADVALYSFGPIKTATALGGAIGLFHDPALADRVRRRIADWPRLSDSWFLRRAAKYAVLKFLSTPAVYGLFFTALTTLSSNPDARIGSLARGFSAGPIEDAIRHRPPPRLLQLLSRRLQTWRAPADATAPLLERLSRSLTVPGLASRPSHWWLAPILTPEPDRLVKCLRSRGYDATRGTTSMRALADAAGTVPPAAAQLIASVVYLPKPADKDAADRLAKAVEGALT